MNFQRYSIFLVVLMAYLVLFIRSKGLFSASAAFLLGQMPDRPAALTKEMAARALVILFLANLLGALMTWKTGEEDTAAHGYLMRNEYGSGDDTKALTLTVDGEETDIDLPVAARKLSEKEVREAIRNAGERLPAEVFGGMAGQGDKSGTIRIERSLKLPEKISGLPVRISWMTSRPEYLDFDGTVTDRVPEEGADVLLTATLTCEELTEELRFSLRVMPKRLAGKEAIRKKAEEAVADGNDGSEAKIVLPDTLDGKKAEWASRENTAGVSLLMTGCLIAACYLYSRVRRSRNEAALREERMRRDYPGIVSKLVLLLTAGLSLRRAFEQIASDYQRQKKQEADAAARRRKRTHVMTICRKREALSPVEMHPGCEEILRTCQEMGHGVSELDAYRNLGKRARLPEYRTLATVLAQNLRKGGKEMTAILEREAEEAYENRKKHAAVLGEQAGTRMLLPMLVMLLLVMVILMVPALALI